MEITEVRIKLMDDAGERLLAFCSITIEGCFVVRDLKIIEGTNGPFVAMPSRKLSAHCPGCNYKNHLRARFCNECGRALKAEEVPVDRDGRTKLFADIAHPINTECREKMQAKVIEAYQLELKASKEPGYVSRYDDLYEHDSVPPHHLTKGREETANRSRGERWGESLRESHTGTEGRISAAGTGGNPENSPGAAIPPAPSTDRERHGNSTGYPFSTKGGAGPGGSDAPENANSLAGPHRSASKDRFQPAQELRKTSSRSSVQPVTPQQEPTDSRETPSPNFGAGIFE